MTLRWAKWVDVWPVCNYKAGVSQRKRSPVPEVSAGQVVRNARVKIGLTQRALALEAGVSDTLINLIEGDKKGISPTVARKLSRSLDIDKSALLGRPVALSDRAQHLSVMEQVCGIAGMTDPQVAKCLSGEFQQVSKTASLDRIPDLPDLNAVQRAVGHLINHATDHNHTVRVYLEGYQDEHRNQGVTISANPILLGAIDRHIASDKKFVAVFRIGQDPSHDLQKILFGLRLHVLQAMRGKSKLVETNFLGGANIHRFVRDLWLTDAGHIDAFPKDYEYYIDQGYLGVGNFPPLQRYICNIRRHAATSTILAYVPTELGQVASELSVPSYCDTRLIQPFLTDASRPSSDFIFAEAAPLSSWMRRLLHANGYVGGDIPLDAQQIADRCQRRAASLQDHLRTAKFTQIFDIDSLKRWASTGMGENIPDQFAEAKLERVRQLEHVLRMLENNSNFALIGRQHLRFDGSNGARSSSDGLSDTRGRVGWLSEFEWKINVGGVDSD